MPDALVALFFGVGIRSICRAIVEWHRSDNHRRNVTSICSTTQSMGAQCLEVGEFAAALDAVRTENAFPTRPVASLNGAPKLARNRDLS